MNQKITVNVIGGGLAGVEASHQLSKQGIKVKLYEMRPINSSPAHKTGFLAELVCSNSFKSSNILSASGLLKEEMRLLDSIIIKAAYASRVESGESLSVDRLLFSKEIERIISKDENIEVIREEICSFDKDTPTIIAVGPLPSTKLSNFLKDFLGRDSLHFFDAVAPIITKESIDFNIAYYKSRYDKGAPDFINLPMNKEEYLNFYNELVSSESVVLEDFEKNVFEGCMPIEVLAKRGVKALLFGPLKPVGLEKENEKRSYAVAQLRIDDINRSTYNLIGFQTNLTFKEQKRVFSLIPGLKNISIVRYGVMHKNTYLESPIYLNNCYQMKDYKNIYVAGQISGVEGYLESASSGLIAGNYMAKQILGTQFVPLSTNTIIGSLANYISTKQKTFNPMNANFSIISQVEMKDKRLKKEFYVKRSLKEINEYLGNKND
ncbi:MAG: methylenetetrahydrofolate--tRNA-(uracil(54)-C(5))-methyltransferase (FADH(2)-oxidizing) TrmFO [Acholeplasmatales bacterium]|jgi:methylenetetrahydrofolate--tRNA-(uracil-5-)-methyltransferase|nr:methylenetetrahydrofolate--tRNA-(uracil(54)-C(5))-methyltransferase (FADH(2)-oxidizing) TrmFO [Acholeplasmatales bacterium]